MSKGGRDGTLVFSDRLGPHGGYPLPQLARAMYTSIQSYTTAAAAVV